MMPTVYLKSIGRMDSGETSSAEWTWAEQREKEGKIKIKSTYCFWETVESRDSSSLRHLMFCVIHLSWEVLSNLRIIWHYPGILKLTGSTHFLSQLCHTLSPISFSTERHKSYKSFFEEWYFSLLKSEDLYLLKLLQLQGAIDPFY